MIRALVIFSFTCVGLISNFSFANSCSAPFADESVLTWDDLPWGQNLEEIALRANAIYISQKRLVDRVYIEHTRIKLPIPEANKESWGFDFNHLNINQSLIETLKQHLRKVFEANYGSELMYSDVGHTHVFASLEDTNYLKSHGIKPSMSFYYEFVLRSHKTKFLYHTAEQLGVPKTEEEQWRKANNTVIGDAIGNINLVPFTKTIPGHSQFFTLYLNANHLGCFNLDGKSFDISMSSTK